MIPAASRTRRRSSALLLALTPLIAMTTACQTTSTAPSTPAAERSFTQDVAFLAKHRDTIVLSAPSGKGKVAVVPAFQGRVMTSAARGDDGQSYGFIKDDLVASDKTLTGINPYGGEDRFWLGPEGGQFSIFFPPGAKAQTLKEWQTPAVIDTTPYAVTQKSDSSVSFSHTTSLTNFSGRTFDLRIDRSVVVLPPADALKDLGVSAEGVDVVAYESRNEITNTGKNAWTKDTGMLSIWILGMYKHSPRTTVAIPLNAHPGQDLKGLVNDTYFGKVPADRLKVVNRAGHDGKPASALVFKADGQYRAKIGVAPAAVAGVAGSYDATRNVLTIVSFTFDKAATDYVNSMWELHQNHPFSGDVINSYNDGASEPGGKPFGPFYEIESSSRAANLAPGQSLHHTHRTVHLEGPKDRLNAVALKALGLSLDQLERAF